MNFRNFQALFASRKNPVEIQTSTESFFIASPRESPYIEPSFTKSVFDAEKPQVILVSAVAATGKSALAQVISSRTEQPLLDLSRHKPVGANTLTGLLTNAFQVSSLSTVFQGLLSGTMGIIIDGIDEARSKTTEQAFNAFLDDIAKLCRNSPSPSFVLLGRTQVLEECWLYFTDREITTGLITIDPFDIAQARQYIDRFTEGPASPQASQYSGARDAILEKLSTAFTTTNPNEPGNFLSFIGYPPVLDAIATLLGQERNYHRLKERLDESISNKVEIDLLYSIAVYIMDREKCEKVIPNIVSPLLVNVPAGDRSANKDSVFDYEEQCIRLVSHCLDIAISLARIPDPALNSRYEEQLATFLPEHPFVTGRNFRNAIFEAVALATLIASGKVSNHELALRYIDSRRHNYYLIYFLNILALDGTVPLMCLRAILGASLEFRATNATIDLQINGPDLDQPGVTEVVDVQLELTVGATDEPSKVFRFQAPWGSRASVHLGARLASAFVSVPGEVILGGGIEVELTSPVEITAERISLRSQALTLRPQPDVGEGQSSRQMERYIVLEADDVVSDVTTLGLAGVDFAILSQDLANLHYPLVQHAHRRIKPPDDPALREKYLRLRKVLTHFRSHSKGALAKYRHKIENPRVAGNRVGSAVLDKLVDDGVLNLSGPLYFLDPERVDSLLGTSWNDLRKGVVSEKLLQYLQSIEVDS